MGKTYEDRLLNRARKGFAHAASRRLEAHADATRKAQSRMARAERGAMRRYLDSLYLAELADLGEA